MFKRAAISTALSLVLTAPAIAEDRPKPEVGDTYTWMSQTQDLLAEGVIWNDRFGDGQDRYKTGGMTQSWLLPESIFLDDPLIAGQASALELQGRGFIATPNNTTNPAAQDRPFAQYVGVGAYLRTFGETEDLTPASSLAIEHRVGIEVGFQGEPLPLFEIQDAIHGMTGGGGVAMTPANTLDSEFLVNAEVKRTHRLHIENGEVDVEFAPYAQGSFGMRENSVRLGTDIIVGSSLKARTWNHEPAIGALIPGGSKERDGLNWLTWVGGDVGYIASDAFLDGGFDNSGPSVNREEITARLRAGLMVEYGDVALSYSATWLSPEFDAQSEGQVVGAFQIKYRF